MTIEDYIKVRIIVDSDGSAEDILKVFKGMKLKEAILLLEEFKSLNTVSDEVVNRFKIDGVEYGLIPDFEEITTGEYLDISAYENDASNIHRLMAILYRPVVSKFGKSYTIEEYSGSSKYMDVMLKVDASIYTRVMSFFLLINQRCMKIMNTSIQSQVEPL